jgi:hypothetical protein
MPGGGLDHHLAPRVRGQGGQERHRVGRVVEHVVAGDHIYGRCAGGHVRPDAEHGPRGSAEGGRPLGQQAQHLLVAVDRGQGRDLRQQRQAGRTRTGTDVHQLAGRLERGLRS